MYASTLPRSNWLRRASMRLAWYRHMPASSSLGDVNIQSVKEEKDLGIIIHQTLKSSQQCVAAASSANRTLGMINRTFVNKHSNIMLELYQSLVRPKLEYCMQAWRPYFLKKRYWPAWEGAAEGHKPDDEWQKFVIQWSITKVWFNYSWDKKIARQGKNWRGLWGLDPHWKTDNPHCKRQGKKLGGRLSSFNPPWAWFLRIHSLWYRNFFIIYTAVFS